MRRLFLAALAAVLSGCAGFNPISSTPSVLPDTEISVAASEAMPGQLNPLWRPVGTGTGVLFGLQDTYWVRLRPRIAKAQWQVVGPFRPGDVIAVRERPDDPPQFISFSTEPDVLAGPTPESAGGLRYFHIGHPPKVKTSGVHVGPVKMDVPKVEITVAAPKVTIGGGGSPSGPTPPAPGLHAGLEPDQQTPSDAQGTMCLSPVRAFNRETFPVRITWRQRFVGEGPSGSCAGQGDTFETADLAPGGLQRRFCGVQVSAASPCRVTTTADQVKAIRLSD